MSREEIARQKEAVLASEYPRIGEASSRCPWGGHCASCAWRIESVQVGPELLDREYTEHDYCRAKY